MTAMPAPSFGVAATLSPEPRRRHPFCYVELQRASYDFDQVLFEMSNGIGDQHRYDGLATRVEIIAAAMVAAVRGKGARR